jgi:hypothetical protein
LADPGNAVPLRSQLDREDGEKEAQPVELHVTARLT